MQIFYLAIVHYGIISTFAHQSSLKGRGIKSGKLVKIRMLRALTD